MNALDSLFTWFSVATVRGTLVALAVLALQAALRRRMPAGWRYALWLPVVLVLATPWLPQSRWSPENFLRPKATEAADAAAPDNIALDSGPLRPRCRQAPLHQRRRRARTGGGLLKQAGSEAPSGW